MKKNALYVLALLVLAFMTWYFVFRNNEEQYSSKEANFTVKDTSEVTAIFLSNLRNENIKLNRKGGEWVLNDSMRPRIDAVQLLLATLSIQKPEQPVTAAYHNDVVTDLSANHTKVEVYNAKGKTHTFYVGKNAGPNNVTYMLNEKAERPFIVKLPLQNTFAGARYFTRLADWRDKKILYHAAPVEYVAVSYKDSVQYSFRLNVQGDTTISGPQAMSTPLNKTRVRSYLKLLDNVYCTGFEDQYIYKDSIIQYGRQLATVEVKRKNHPSDYITFYFKPPNKGTKSRLKIANEEYDFDQFLALLNKRDFILLSRGSSEKVLRSYPEFFQSN